MTIPFTCPFCRRRAKAPDRAAGQRVNCPACKKPLMLPRHSEQEAFPAAGLDDVFDAPAANEPAAGEPGVAFTCPACCRDLHGQPGTKLACPCGQRVQVPAAPPPESRTVLGNLAPVLEGIAERPPAPPPLPVPLEPPPVPVYVQAPPQPVYLAPPPVYLQQGYACPQCGSQHPPRVEQKMSSDAWGLFVVLLIVFFPLCWIPLVTMKVTHRTCADCGTRLS